MKNGIKGFGKIYGYKIGHYQDQFQLRITIIILAITITILSKCCD